MVWSEPRRGGKLRDIAFGSIKAADFKAVVIRFRIEKDPLLVCHAGLRKVTNTCNLKVDGTGWYWLLQDESSGYYIFASSYNGFPTLPIW